MKKTSVLLTITLLLSAIVCGCKADIARNGDMNELSENRYFEIVESIEEKHPNITKIFMLPKIFMLDQMLFVFYENNKLLSYEISNDSLLEVDTVGSYVVNSKSIKKLNDNTIAIMYANKLLLLDTGSREVFKNYEYDEKEIDAFDISEDATKLVYTDRNDKMYISDIDLERSEEISYQHHFDTRSRAITPKFIGSSSVAFSIIGNNIGTNIGVYNVDSKNTDVLHIDDRIVGHSLNLECTKEYAVLSNEYYSHIITLDKLSLKETLTLSEEFYMFPRINISNDSVVFLDVKNNIALYSFDLEETTVFEEISYNSSLRWSDKESYFILNLISR